MSLEAHLHEGERTLARIWKSMALRGVIAIAFSVVILVWPNIGVTALVALFGAFAIVSGLATIAGTLSVPMPDNRHAGLVIAGLLGIAVGVVVFVWPSLSALGLLYAVAAWAIATGIAEFVLSFSLPLSGRRSLVIGLSGLLSIAFGVIMFVKPGAGAIALLALIAAFALVSGVMQVAFAFELRAVVGELERTFRAHARAKPLTNG